MAHRKRIESKYGASRAARAKAGVRVEQARAGRALASSAMGPSGMACGELRREVLAGGHGFHRPPLTDCYGPRPGFSSGDA